MNTRLIAIGILGGLGAGVLVFMGWLAIAAGNADAAGWVAAGFLALREVVSKIESVTLRIVPPPGGEMPVAA